MKSWVQVKLENPPLVYSRPWMVLLRHPSQEEVFFTVERLESQQAAEDLADAVEMIQAEMFDALADELGYTRDHFGSGYAYNPKR